MSVKLLTPIQDHVLYKLYKSLYITLYFNRFRGKPAISSLDGLSPLTTIRPSIMQHTRVRSSLGCYTTFNLIMVRSLDFGSYIYNYHNFLFAFAAPTFINLSLLYIYTH